jgi:transposase
VLVLGRLGWTLRRIEEATGVRRETASRYLKAAGVSVRSPRSRSRPNRPVRRGCPPILRPQGRQKAASGECVSPDPGADRTSKAASGEGCHPTPDRGSQGRAGHRRRATASRTASASSDGSGSVATPRRSGDLVTDHDFVGGYASVKRFARKLRGRRAREERAVIETAPGEEAQVDYGEGPMVPHPETGKYRRTRLFVLTLGFSRKAVRLLLFRSSSREWAELHERAFRPLGGATRIVVQDNLREGILEPDIYDPGLNPLYRDVLGHYGAIAMPCRVGDPDRKGKVESGVGHASARRSKALASRGSTRRRPIWTGGRNAGPTRASTARRSDR